MSAEEKSKELIDKFMKYSDRGATLSSLSIGGHRGINTSAIAVKKNAKQCALICVDEILSLAYALHDFTETEFINTEYWQQVKEKIQSL